MKRGEAFSLRVGPVTTTQIVMYAGASGDFNPIHFDDAIARQSGLEGVIAHGLLTMGFAARLAGQCSRATWVKAIGGRFLSPVRPGDVVHLSAAVVDAEDGKTGSGEVRLDIDGTVNGRAVLRGFAVLAERAAGDKQHG